MKISIDVDLCQRHGECALSAPEVFSLADDGPVRVLLEDPPIKLHAKVADALRYCPTGAISMTSE